MASSRAAGIVEAVSAEPVGETTPVLACPDCGCLVTDRVVHEPVCPGRDGAPTTTEKDNFAARVVDWLDSLDAEQLERDSLDNAGFDTNATVAVIAELRRQAETLP